MNKQPGLLFHLASQDFAAAEFILFITRDARYEIFILILITGKKNVVADTVSDNMCICAITLP